jgi:hypothetical protein
MTDYQAGFISRPAFTKLAGLYNLSNNLRQVYMQPALSAFLHTR